MRRLLRFLIPISFALALSACLGPDESVMAEAAQGRAQARRVEISEAGLSIQLPAEMKEVPVKGIDSLVRMYESSELKLLMDYGAYSDSFKNIPDAATDLQIEEALIIDGRSAKLVTYVLASGAGGRPGFPYFAGIHFADLGRGPRFKLTFSASARTPEAQSLAEQIMKTIVFSE